MFFSFTISSAVQRLEMNFGIFFSPIEHMSDGDRFESGGFGLELILRLLLRCHAISFIILAQLGPAVRTVSIEIAK